MNLFVDSSALFSILDRTEDRHAAADAFFSEALAARHHLISHNYVIAEAAALAQRRLGSVAANSLLLRFPPLLELVWVSPDIHDAAVAAFVASPSRGVSLVDRVSFEVMRREGIQVAFAFDADFITAGFRTVP